MHKATRNGKSEYDLYADYENIKEALADATQDVKGRVGEMFYQSLSGMKTKSSDLKEMTSEYIGKRPFTSLGLAVLAGMVLSYLFKK